MLGKTKIYLLRCPIDKSIKYIGKTSKEALASRLAGHISYAFRKKHLNGKHKWIRELADLDLVPIIELIEEVDDSLWAEKERYWIKFYSEKYSLFNKTLGGEDFVFKSGNNPWNKGGGEKVSLESRLKMSNSHKGKILSEAHKRAISKTLSGVKKKKGNYQSSCRKKILQYSLEGIFIREWESLSEAGKSLNIDRRNISQNCLNNTKSSGEFIWKYFEEGYSKEIKVDLNIKSFRINQYSLDGVFLREFKSAIEAAKYIMSLEPYNRKITNLKSASERIRKACKNKEIYRNFKWLYLKKEEKITNNIN